MSDGESKISFRRLITDFVLLIGSFFAAHYLKYQSLAPSPHYAHLLLLLGCSWLIISLLTRKFHPESYTGYWKSIFVHARSDLFLLFFVSFWVVILDISHYSRIQIFGTIGLLFVAELVIFTVYHFLIRKQTTPTAAVIKKKNNRLYSLPIIDFILFSLVFLLIHYPKRGNFIPDHEYEILFYIMTGLWAVTAFLTRKFDKRHFQTYFFAVSPYLKSVIFMVLIMATLIFGLQMFHNFRLQIFSFLLLFAGLELLLLLVYYLNYKETAMDVESTREIRSIMRQVYLATNTDNEADKRDILFQSIDASMKEVYLKDQPQVYDFLKRAIDLSRITRVETMILDTSEMSNFNLISLSHTRLMINLHRLNDIRWINRYFLQAQAMLADGGYLAGRAETIDVLMRRFRKKYPKYIVEFFYVFHFIWARIFPKLSLTKKFYFNMTKGKKRAISRTEILGRLSFCGFKIIAEEYIDNALYFVAQKVKTPSMDDNPSYGPLVRFERVGQNGNLIYTHKFRTMYPYSEYLQEYVHQLNQLQEGGKFKDDFRVTSYGKIMRKLWIDELPMLYNWIKGDLQLVGVRPLSRHYLNLYTPELQELRKKVKPGLVPPFYADMPKTLEEIMASEERYIKAYLERRFVTQWRYFWKSFYNIFFKKARSA